MGQIGLGSSLGVLGLPGALSRRTLTSAHAQQVAAAVSGVEDAPHVGMRHVEVAADRTLRLIGQRLPARERYGPQDSAQVLRQWVFSRAEW